MTRLEAASRPANAPADRDFAKLWAGQTISAFGTLLTRNALPFAAILTLHATPFQMGVLNSLDLAAGLSLGLVAGAWIDRVRRRPVMILSDVLRAGLLAAVPLIAWLWALRMEHLYMVAALVGVCTVFFDVALLSYLPTLVVPSRLVDANRKLAAGASAMEVVAFAAGGWLVQVLTAPLALLVDAATFLVSAVSLLAIRAPEPPAVARPTPSLAREIREGLIALARDPRLRALTASRATVDCSLGIGGAVYMLFVTRVLGFRPGVLGMIFAVGGASALIGSLWAGAAGRRLGVRRSMMVGVSVSGLASLLVPLAHGDTVASGALLVGQQLLGDAAAVVYGIHQTSALQTLAPPALRGRVNGAARVVHLGAMIVGSLAGGLLAERWGMRAVLAAAGIVRVAGAWWMRRLDTRALEPTPGASLSA